MLHCGGEELPRHELANIVTPTATETWRPLPHADFVNMIQDELENQGLRVINEAHGVTRKTTKTHGENAVNGGNYFGLFEVRGEAFSYDDRALTFGMRNSHLKRFGGQIVIGDKVFVCDNMCFHGEYSIGHKHTKNILDDKTGIRPRLVDAISKLLVVSKHIEQRYDEYKSKQMSNGLAEVIMIDALRKGVVTSTQLPKVVQQWDTPDHEDFAKHKNGWRLFNGFTEALKGTSPIELPQRTMKLRNIMDRRCELPIFGMDEIAEAA
jgi:hypothetical protein